MTSNQKLALARRLVLAFRAHSPGVLVALALCFMASCGSNLSATEAAFQSVEASVEKADTSARPGTFNASVRWSDAGCDAPEWQIWLWGQWQRAEVRDISDEYRDGAARMLQLRTQRGSAKDAHGWAYPIVEVISELDP